MSENAWLNFLRNTSLICNGIGLVVALGFLFGPKVIMAISKAIDKPHSIVNIEKIFITKARIILGFTLLVISVLMLLLVTLAGA